MLLSTLKMEALRSSETSVNFSDYISSHPSGNNFISHHREISYFTPKFYSLCYKIIIIIIIIIIIRLLAVGNH
jgi:hypothetical protein